MINAAVTVFVGIIFVFLGFKLAGKLKRRWSKRTRIVIALCVFLVGIGINYAVSLLYQYDGRIGFKPYELPLQHPIITYLLSGMIHGFTIAFAMGLVTGGEDQPK